MMNNFGFEFGQLLNLLMTRSGPSKPGIRFGQISFFFCGVVHPHWVPSLVLILVHKAVVIVLILAITADLTIFPGKLMNPLHLFNDLTHCCSRLVLVGR